MSTVDHDLLGSLAGDGKRRFVYPADVDGRFTRLRKLTFLVLIAIYVALPWIQIGGHPAVFLDIEHRRFHLFGAAFGAQDAWLLFFVLAGIGLGLLVVTAVLGRLWCGYACPQTVFLEGVFRRIERWIEGPASQRKRRDAEPLSVDKLVRKLAKHSLFFALALVIAHVFLSYFVSLPRMFEMMRDNPSAHPAAFGWVASITLLVYGNFAWFREQLCMIVCPYGRLQSVLIDQDSLVIGYDAVRGEPRGKKSRSLPIAAEQANGDCVDCSRCVAVCPTGIDIRNGLQLECVGCAACIDACDAIMDKVGRPRGLIRYDSLSGLAGAKRRIVRPRLFLYGAIALALLIGSAFAVRSHTPFEVNLIRAPGMPYALFDSRLRNSFEVHLVNNGSGPMTFVVEAIDSPLDVQLPTRSVELAGGQSTRIPLLAEVPGDRFRPGQWLELRVRTRSGSEQMDRVVRARFLGPNR